jgi:ubiquinol-cytochrome c reductase cytochrome b subunit
VIGETLVEYIRGDYSISDITLNRFFALHVIVLPMALIALVFVHIVALHEVGSNNPDGVEIKDYKGPDGIPLDGVAFHPYHTSKDLVALVVFLMFFFGIVFFAPEMGGYFLEYANFDPADTRVTPEHIQPVWYFTPFYTMLRAVPDKLFGAMTMGAAVLLPVLLPWLDKSRVNSIRYRGWMYKSALATFAVSFLVLGWLGTQPATVLYVRLAQLFTALYFLFFLLMPYYTTIDKTKPVPERVVWHE